MRNGSTDTRNDRTHRCEYTPGTCASSTARGSGSSQRLGRHSSASGPQSVGSRFAAVMFITTRVFFGTGIADTVVPSLRWIGSSRGMTVSWVVLREGVSLLRWEARRVERVRRTGHFTYSRMSDETPGYLRMRGQHPSRLRINRSAEGRM